MRDFITSYRMLNWKCISLMTTVEEVSTENITTCSPIPHTIPKCDADCNKSRVTGYGRYVRII